MQFSLRALHATATHSIEYDHDLIHSIECDHDLIRGLAALFQRAKLCMISVLVISSVLCLPALVLVMVTYIHQVLKLQAKVSSFQVVVSWVSLDDFESPSLKTVS